MNNSIILLIIFLLILLFFWWIYKRLQIYEVFDKVLDEIHDDLKNIKTREDSQRIRGYLKNMENIIIPLNYGIKNYMFKSKKRIYLELRKQVFGDEEDE